MIPERASVSADSDPGVGTCFGFLIHAGMPLKYLRQGMGDPLQVVSSTQAAPPYEGRLLGEWRARLGSPFQARLYQHRSRFNLWISGEGWYGVDPAAGEIVVHRPEVDGWKEERLWGIPAALCCLHRGDYPLHAAAVEVGGEAVLLAGPGRFGKTTLAAGFLRTGSRVLSEDLSCVRLSSHPEVIPGPALLRLRRDIFDRMDLPGVVLAGEYDDRICVAIRPEQRGDCSPVPIRAILLLRVDDRISVERVPPAQAMADLWSLTFRMSTDDDRSRRFKTVADIVNHIPVWNLVRPLELELLPATIERILAALTDSYG